MNAIVHFSVGLMLGMCILLRRPWAAQVKFPLIFASGVWAMIPDGWRLVGHVGLDGVALLAYRFHGSVLANVFWLHQLLDRLETGEPILEMTTAVFLLCLCVGVFTMLNTWE